MVEPPSHLSEVIAGGMIPTITVSSSAAETTLSALPRSTPRISTSSTNVAGGGVHRVIQQCPPSSLNTVLIEAGVGRGQVLAKELIKAGIGKGWCVPSSKTVRPEEHRGHVDASTSANNPLPITMRLDCQGPPISYSEATSRPLWRETITEDNLQMCDVCMKTVAHDKEKAAAQATLDCIKQQDGMNKPPEGRKRNVSLKKLTSMRPNGGWPRRELNGRRNITGSGGPPELVLTLSLIPLDSVSTHGLNRTSIRPPNGLGTCGVPAPWTINN